MRRRVAWTVVRRAECAEPRAWDTVRGAVLPLIRARRHALSCHRAPHFGNSVQVGGSGAQGRNRTTDTGFSVPFCPSEKARFPLGTSVKHVPRPVKAGTPNHG